MSATFAIQFCLAHLIRDVKFLTTLPDAATKAYGERLRCALKELFEVIHRRDELSAVVFERRLKAARDVVLSAGMTDVPTTRHAENMAQAISQARRGVFHVYHDAGRGADEQSCGASDSVRGDRSAHHAGDAERNGAALERTDLDDDRHVCGTGPVGVWIPEGMRWELVRGSSVAFAVAVGSAGMREAMRRV